MSEQKLRSALRDLATIHDQGQLADAQMGYADACRIVGGRPDADERARQVAHLSAGDIMKCKDIARAAAVMFNVTEAKAEALAREEMVRDPWSDIALEVIGAFLPEPTSQPISGAKPARRLRKW